MGDRQENGEWLRNAVERRNMSARVEAEGIMRFLKGHAPPAVVKRVFDDIIAASYQGEDS